MKRQHFTFLIISTLIFSACIPLNHNSKPPTQSLSKATPTLEPFHSTVTFNNIQYFIHWFAVNKPSQLSLVSNLSSRNSSLSFYKESNCRYLINGGFYSRQFEHLGYFYSNNQLLAPFHPNQLLNGIFWLSHDYKAYISASPPTSPPVFGLQSGPILIQNSKPLVLQLTQDQPAKRSTAIILDDNSLVFAHLTSNNLTSGPRLTDLPNIISIFGQVQGLNINSAINLDGGSASSFKSPNFHSQEINLVGSFFCLQ